MATYLNHVTVKAARNGTTSHVVDPSSATGVVDGTPFTPTAGRLLVCLVGGSVVNATPSGWTLPTNGAQVNMGGLYVFHRDAAGGDTVTLTHGTSSDYPIAVDFYEFAAGSTFVGAAGNVSVSSGGAGPTLSGLTGTNWLAGALNVSNPQTGATTISWSVGVEEVDVSEPQSGTDGYAYGLTVSEDFTGASYSTAATWTGATVHPAERLVFAVNVAAGPPAETLTFSTVDATGWTLTGASAQGALSDSSDATYVTSAVSPTGQNLDLTLQPIETPAGDLTVQVRTSRIDATSASIVGTLRDGGTTVATAATVNPGTSAGNVTVTFPAANISGVTEAKWRSGTLVVRLAVTAA